MLTHLSKGKPSQHMMSREPLTRKTTAINPIPRKKDLVDHPNLKLMKTQHLCDDLQHKIVHYHIFISWQAITAKSDSCHVSTVSCPRRFYDTCIQHGRLCVVWCQLEGFSLVQVMKSSCFFFLSMHCVLPNILLLSIEHMFQMPI